MICIKQGNHQPLVWRDTTALLFLGRPAGKHSCTLQISSTSNNSDLFKNKLKMSCLILLPLIQMLQKKWRNDCNIICSELTEYKHKHIAFCHLRIDTPWAALEAQERSIKGNFKKSTSPWHKYTEIFEIVL